jgi:hypothetical protein
LPVPGLLVLTVLVRVLKALIIWPTFSYELFGYDLTPLVEGWDASTYHWVVDSATIH